MKGLIPKSAAYKWATIQIDCPKLVQLHNRVVSSVVTYGLGAKAKFSDKVGEFGKIDCSGYVRWLLGQFGVEIVDGSYNQLDQIKNAGFKPTTRDAGLLHDGVLRIAFLRASDSTSNIGHVALVLNGETIESHGSRGPNRRPWTGEGWQSKAQLFVLTKPK